ncbi:hypothetical protein D0T11_19630 [Hymenobacter rubripertinctus]|uniref:Uncharacterized protein n=1 Tax=Hymenobacter rubripertinctus TaxID=2029981 RepID=A0A418QLP6_9BACT|nr:hypothetical protein D0T11_19630 [Hymenobacter rubripertinctus]
MLLAGLGAGSVLGVSCQKSEQAVPAANLAQMEGFNAKAGAAITLSNAQKWVQSYRTSPAVSKGGSLAYYLGNQAFKLVQDQPGCVGIRFYNAIDANGDQTIVYVGVDKNGRDMIPRKDEAGNPVYASGVVGDSAERCPPMCDDTTPLLDLTSVPAQ